MPGNQRGAALQESLRPGSNFCLCHGIAGNAEILALLDDGADHPAVIGAAAFGMQQYASGSWPCGAGVEVRPALMTGLAGIGHFYPRLYDPGVPSPLWIGRPLTPAASELLPRGDRVRSSERLQPESIERNRST